MTSKGRIIKSISGSPTYCWDLLQSYVYTRLFYLYMYIFFNTILIYLSSSQSTFHFPHFCGCTNISLPLPGRHDYSLLLKLVVTTKWSKLTHSRLLRLGTLEIFARRTNISSGGYVCEMRAKPGEGGRFSWLIFHLY